MKSNLVISLILGFSMLLCPIAALGKSGENHAPAESKAVISENTEEYISVLASSDSSISRVGVREYLIGCVAAEMPANYHSQALCAQAVASYTYAKRIMKNNSESKKTLFSGADITDDTGTHQGYLNKNARKELWGDKFDEYEQKISAAVDEVLGAYISFEGDYALTVYHSISSGRTASAKSLWGSDIPYLSGVESPGDKLSPEYISESYFTENEFRSAAEKAGISVSGNADEWIGKIVTAEGGYAEKVTVCGTEIGGAVFREAFSLKSTAFDITYSDDKFKITCNGHGHGVGMSQYGADYMARQGNSWREILIHYYPETEIIEPQLTEKPPA